MAARETVVLSVEPEDRAPAVIEKALKGCMSITYGEEDLAQLVIIALHAEGIGFCWLESAS